MGVRFPSAGVANTLGGGLTLAAETAFITTPLLTLPLDGAQVVIVWYCVITAGTGTTAIAIRLRRGLTIAGPLLNLGTPITIAAGSAGVFSGLWIDSPGAAAGLQYTLSGQQTGGTANGVVGDIAFYAFAL